jgi:Protein of unknown function (DUF3027)
VVDDAPLEPDHPAAPAAGSVEAPTAAAPIDEPPVAEPVDEPLVAEPVDEAPVAEPPVDEAPVTDAQLDERPVGGHPVDESPTEEVPAKPARTRAKATAPRSPRPVRDAAPDAVCAAAIEIARAAAVEEAGDEGAVGEHLGVEAEGDRLVLHRFACTTRAYPGWAWTVIVTRAPRIRKVTVDDVVLMPYSGALLAPMWVPWSQRLRPGDVGVGDLLPTAVDDARLALRVTDVEEFVDTEAFLELGLGRPRVLSAVGREEACDRWYAGESGPDASIAKVAPATCLTCGFHVRLSGALGRMFGVCANEMAPDDARVTSVDHGCGAHSEALVAPSAHPEPVVFEDDPGGAVPGDVELVGVGAPADASTPAPGEPAPAPGDAD